MELIYILMYRHSDEPIWFIEKVFFSMERAQEEMQGYQKYADVYNTIEYKIQTEAVED